MRSRAHIAIVAAISACVVACTIKDSPTPTLSGPSDFGPAPIPTFNYSPAPVFQNQAVLFDGTPSLPGPNASSIVTYAWDFGDGTTASGAKITHTFASTDTKAVAKIVTLTVTNDRGVTAVATRTVTVNISTPPSGDFVVSPDKPTVGDTLVFNASGVQPAANRTIVSYVWVWGDNTPNGSGVVTTHVYGAAAGYNVTLTATDDIGQQKVFSKLITIGNGSPTAKFTPTPTTVIAPGAVSLDASASSATGTATITSYNWAFSDGSPPTQTTSTPTVSHTFVTVGPQTVTLTVTDSLGRTSVPFVVTITVQ